MNEIHEQAFLIPRMMWVFPLIHLLFVVLRS